MNFDDEPDFSKVSEENFTDADKWILSKLNGTIKEVTENIEKFELGIGLSKVYEFIWEEFCDWYIELVKPRLYDKDSEGRLEALYVLNKVLGDSMKLLHPFMPFITEEIYLSLFGSGESIMISDWPEFEDSMNFPAEEKAMNFVMEAIRGIRNARSNMNVPPSRKAQIFFVTETEGNMRILLDAEAYFIKLAGASSIAVQADESGIPADAISVVIDGAKIFMPLSDLIDIEKEVSRLQGEADKLEQEMKRAEGKLNNPKFVSKAPEKLVESEKEKLVKYTKMHEEVLHRLKELENI